MNHFQVDLIKDKILKALLLFAIPILISNIFQQFYNTMDTAIVGNFLGDDSLAAIGASAAVYELLVNFALGVGNGFSIVIARFFGSGDQEQVKRGVAGSLVIGLFLTAAIMLFSIVGLRPLMVLLKTPADIIDESLSYIFTIGICIGVMFAYNLFAGMLRAIGNSVMPLVFLIFSSVVNIILDLVFIRIFGMGIRGAAIATVIAQGLSAILCFFYILKCAHNLIPEKKHFVKDATLYKELAGQGFSMGFMMAIVSSGTVIMQSAINGFGKLTIAGHATARKINSFFMMPCGTLATSVSTFVSQNRGANQKQRIRDGVKLGFKLSIGWGLLSIIILTLFARTFAVLISGSSEPTILNNSTLYLRIQAPFYAVLGILLILRTSLQGLGKKIVPLISSVIECVGKILFTIFIIPPFGYIAVIFCEPVIWCCMMLQLIYAFKNNEYMREP